MKYANLEWRDGQPYSPDFDDVYFSADDGIAETEHVFIHHNDLLLRFQQNTKKHFVIGEIGFGSGLNFLIAVKHWLALSQTEQTLHFYSLENTPFTLDDIIRAQQVWPELSSLAVVFQKHYQVASYGFHQFDLFAGRVKLVLMIGEAQTMLTQMQSKVDAWFLDGFAPARNVEMWSDHVFSQIRRLSYAHTTFSTYTAAGFVRRGLIDHGFSVEKVQGIANKRHMLKGEFSDEDDVDTKLLQPWFENKAQQLKNKKITIIGAGIAGITSAWALTKRGFEVEIIEAEKKVAAQASGNLQGILMPRLSLQDSADAEFYTSAFFYALRCLNALDSQQTCWQQTGGIQLASSERIKKQIEKYPQDAILAQVLDAKSATEISGLRIKESVHYFSQASCVSPQLLLQCMVDEMGDALKITYQTKVESIEFKNNQWQLINRANEVIKETPNLVLANAWQVKQFAQFEHLQIQPVRGQLSYFKPNEKSKKVKMPISFDAYLMPENNGQHLSGASFELGDSDTELRIKDFRDNLQSINKQFGKLFAEDDICGGRASVRAVTPDRMPVVGCVSDQAQVLIDYADLHKGKPAHKYPLTNVLPNLYVNAGYGARGFTSVFLCSELLAAIICDEPLPVSNRVRYALHSSRFLIRSLKKRRD